MKKSAPFFELKKSWGYIAILFGLLIFAIWPLFKVGFGAAHDAVWHIARFYQFHLSFSSGQIPVRWAPTLFGGLGYPAFIVNFHLPYYLMELIYRLGVSLVETYKIVLGLSILASGVFSFLWLSRYFGKVAALVGSIFFVYSPYRFATVYARGALGEAVAIALVPLVFLALELEREGKNFAKPLFSLAVFLLIIAHPSIFLIFSPMIIACIFRRDLVFWLILGILASSFQTLPVLFERKYLMFDEVYKNVYIGHFPNIFEVFRIPAAGVDLGTPFAIGIINWLITIAAFFTFVKFREKSFKKLLMILTFLFFAIGLFLMTKASSWFWERIPFLSTVLFPWRFLNILVFTSSILAAYFVYKIKKSRVRLKLLISLVMVILVIYVSRHWWGWPGTIPITDDYYKSYKETTTAGGEFTPKGITRNITEFSRPKSEFSRPKSDFSRPKSDFSRPKIEILGDGQITYSKVENNYLNFIAHLASDSKIKLGILYFPGWEVRANGKRVTIINNYKHSNLDYSGLIVFSLPYGEHNVEVKFAETNIRKFGNYLSLISLVAIFYLLKGYLYGKNK